MLSIHEIVLDLTIWAKYYMNFNEKQTNKQFCNNSIDLYNVHVQTKTKYEQSVLCNTVYHTMHSIPSTYLICNIQSCILNAI